MNLAFSRLVGTQVPSPFFIRTKSSSPRRTKLARPGEDER
jgi:hypothetical protein